ncbi:MAG TPA: hypothetical protein VMH90_06735 [Thermoplasmata archaeon]|nr:hypothetical protein [Thermoplasmata archaeon]
MTTQLKGEMRLGPDGNAAYFQGVKFLRIDRFSFAYTVEPEYAQAAGWKPSQRVPVPTDLNPQVRYQDNSEPGSPNVDTGVRPYPSGTYEALAHEVQVVVPVESGEADPSQIGPNGTEVTLLCPQMPGQTKDPLGIRVFIEP